MADGFADGGGFDPGQDGFDPGVDIVAIGKLGVAHAFGSPGFVTVEGEEKQALEGVALAFEVGPVTGKLTGLFIRIDFVFDDIERAKGWVAQDDVQKTILDEDFAFDQPEAVIERPRWQQEGGVCAAGHLEKGFDEQMALGVAGARVEQEGEKIGVEFFAAAVSKKVENVETGGALAVGKFGGLLFVLETSLEGCEFIHKAQGFGVMQSGEALEELGDFWQGGRGGVLHFKPSPAPDR